MLHQSSLVSSASSSASSIHVTSHPAIHSQHEASSSGINTIFSNSLNVEAPIWLIDSSANKHICSSIQFFSSFYSISPIHVNLPSGHSVIVKHAGDVQFSPHFYIKHVLFSPQFKVNLIFVSKLCKLLPCTVHFHTDRCLIQDLTSQTMICLGEIHDGLYRLKFLDSFIHNSSLHSRLPHCNKFINKISVF